MSDFEALLRENRGSLERFVRFRIADSADAEDVLQEVCIAAYRKFSQLRNPDAFRPWLLSIARNKCNDYFRRRAAVLEIPLEAVTEQELCHSRMGITAVPAVRETLERLGNKDKQILYLYFFRELPQADIAKQLNIPLGTVKSRLHTAKQHFKEHYPYPPKGDDTMTKLPEIMPQYSIEKMDEPSFPVQWEELMGWFLVPRLGEKLTWAMYDMPSRKCTDIFDMEVTGKAKVHGIEGVELTAKEIPCTGGRDKISRTFVAQLTDTHCRYLATIRNDGDVRNFITFLDEEFLPNWGFGENNCGNETNLVQKGDIVRSGSAITTAQKEFLLDIVGRYRVSIGGRSYDTVCVMDIETYNCGVASEQFLDKNGRTVLWRRFNRDNWAFDQYGKLWSQLLPDNERLTINGDTYVHWYDCITEHIL